MHLPTLTTNQQNTVKIGAAALVSYFVATAVVVTVGKLAAVTFVGVGTYKYATTPNRYTSPSRWENIKALASDTTKTITDFFKRVGA